MRRFNKILCIVDPVASMDTAVMQAKRIAEDNQAEITFMSVVQIATSWRTVFGSKEEYVQAFENIEKTKSIAIENHVRSLASNTTPDIVIAKGISFIEIIKRVIHHQYDLVVKCAEDVDWIGRMFGSDDMHLLRKCPCPVLLLKPGHTESFRNILATVDVNDDFNDEEQGRVQHELNQLVLECSVSLSLPELSEMHIGSAWEAYAEDWLRNGAFTSQPEEKVNRYVAQARKECSSKLDLLVKKMEEMLGKAAVQYIQPKSHLVKGKASREIPLMVENYDIDVIVMGTVGRVGIPGLIIGNTAEAILEQTKCSVLAVKPNGFKTPIE